MATSWRESPSFRVLEGLAILTDCSARVTRPQQKSRCAVHGFGICFRVLDGDIVQQVVVI